MNNVTSRTSRLGVVQKGHRSPRIRNGRRPTISTSQIFDGLKEALASGPLLHEYVFTTLFPCDHYRFYKARVYLQENGYVLVGPKSRIWYPTDKTQLLSLARIMPALEPQFVASNTHPGMDQLDCPLCGLITRPWADQAFGREWYFGIHIKKSVAHR